MNTVDATSPSLCLGTALSGVNLFTICHEFERFSTYLPDTKVVVSYGGVNIKIPNELLKNECPHVVLGTPGRYLHRPGTCEKMYRRSSR
ncbi:hypothetical protein MKW98_006927 [Papaver atlanticum]|uniref:Uncharacterized protein n=1 Tax=Papaver atlanticum TaxID=357466 RepID=A0AAD4XKE4_9MAGN|nr:hypothetical protein MKW98_006927 [Papaver atlanticum]